MSITPEEIEEKAFRERFRGYDPVDVDQFLDDIATAFRELLAQHEANAARSRELEELARGDVGGLMHRTMAEVERITADARNRAKQELERARRDAQELLDQAEISAQKTIAGARERAQREEQQAKRQAVEARDSAEDTLRTSRGKAHRELEQARIQIDRVRTAVNQLEQFRASYEDRLQSIVSEQFGVFERIYQLLSLPELPRELRGLDGVSGDVDQALVAMGQHGTNGQQPGGASPHAGDAAGQGHPGNHGTDQAPGAEEGIAEPEDAGENAAAI
jgi:DivIVA domain-containing protein